ncbi:MAG TPA: winged helix-turn-helix transcriptional regulator [Solirubrobacteraceae bacterium]|jgi:hypothetical protein|nr:winged helix-turn-helix transcriptional regulator [Solirubrobacteraceae bacterium]
MQIPVLDDDQLLGESMLEEIRRTAERRLHQIEPLLEEAEQLRDVLEVLSRRTTGQQTSAVAKHTRRNRSAATASSKRPGSRVRSDGGARAAKGSNKRAIMQLVAQKPGITAAQIAQLTGMKRTVVASTVSRLKRYGELLDHEGGGVCLPARPLAARPAGVVPAASAPRPAVAATRRSRPRRLASSLERRAA